MGQCMIIDVNEPTEKGHSEHDQNKEVEMMRDVSLNSPVPTVETETPRHVQFHDQVTVIPYSSAPVGLTPQIEPPSVRPLSRGSPRLPRVFTFNTAVDDCLYRPRCSKSWQIKPFQPTS